MQLAFLNNAPAANVITHVSHYTFTHMGTVNYLLNAGFFTNYYTITEVFLRKAKRLQPQNFSWFALYGITTGITVLLLNSTNTVSFPLKFIWLIIFLCSTCLGQMTYVHFGTHNTLHSYTCMLPYFTTVIKFCCYISLMNITAWGCSWCNLLNSFCFFRHHFSCSGLL